MFPSARLQLRSAAFLCALLAPFCARADTWREVKSPHFRVITDSSESAARDVASQFEQMRHVFSGVLQKGDVETGAPLTIVAARDLSTFKLLDPAFGKGTGTQIAGLFHPGWEKQLALIRLDTWTDQNQVVVYHEYAHSIIHANTHWIPLWLDEGLAEFYGYTRFREKIFIGAPSARAGLLREETLIPAEQMLAMRHSIDKDERRSQLFYAESWAMVHMMVFGPGMGNGEKLGTFLKKVSDREPQKQAFQETFGDFKAFDDALSRYVMRFSFSAGVVPADEHMDRKTFTARVLTPAEVSYEIGCVQISLREHKTGRALVQKALELDPKLAAAHEELGYAAFEDGKDTEAIAEWKQAVALDSSLPRSNFALAMTTKPLAQQSHDELLDTQRALRHVVELAPKFAPAYVQLALTEWRLGMVQQAFNDAHKAEALEPSRAGYRILSGNILLQGKQPALAADYSRYVATHWDGPDHNEAVDLWSRVPAANRSAGPNLALEYPAGNTVVRGHILELTCASAPGEKLKLVIQPDDPGAAALHLAPAKFFMSGFSDTLWWGEDHFSMCHHMVGSPAVVAFTPSGNNAGEFAELDIRDEWPALKLAPESAPARAASAAPQPAAAPPAASQPASSTP